MAEYLRALLVVMVIGVAYFLTVRKALLDLLPQDTFNRWRNLWFATTLILFLSHGIWIATLAIGVVLLIYRRREAHVMGLYFVLLFAAPPVPAEIPGLGIIDHLWVLNHYRLLGLTLLLPTALFLYQRSSTPRLGASPVDWMVLGYVVLLSMLSFRDGSATSGLRTILSLWIDIFLPYYVASRSIRTLEGMKQAMTGFVIGAMLVGALAMFEVLRSWKLYSAVLGTLGVSQWLFGGYLTRSGFLRPNAAVGNSIVLGYVQVVALGFYFYLQAFLSRPRHRWMGLGLLVGGIVASLSRGPWVGAAVLVVVYLFIGPNPVKRLGLLALASLVSLFVLSLLPSGQLLIDMLPIVGEIEQGNVEYRANLLTAALPVIERHLLFGSHDYLNAPELQVMRQGEGIIDVVNAYVGVALHSGLLGLALFLGAFIGALKQVRNAVHMTRRSDPQTAMLGRALIATVLAIMFIIYTVSSIIAIPIVYWSVLGMCVAYAGLVREQARDPREALSP
jgi:hypothetical protein